MPVVGAKRRNSGPKVGIGDQLIAQKGDRRHQESTGEGGMERHVAKSGHWKPEVGHIGRSQEGQVHINEEFAKGQN